MSPLYLSRPQRSLITHCLHPATDYQKLDFHFYAVVFVFLVKRIPNSFTKSSKSNYLDEKALKDVQSPNSHSRPCFCLHPARKII